MDEQQQPISETEPQPTEAEPPKVLSFKQAVNECHRELIAVGKRASAPGYNFAKAEDIARAVKTVAGPHGVVVTRVRVDVTPWVGPATVELRPGKYDKAPEGQAHITGAHAIIGHLRAHYEVSYAPTGEVETGLYQDQVIARGAGRSSDQDVNTAITFAHTYFLRGYFNIPTVDVDPNHERSGRAQDSRRQGGR